MKPVWYDFVKERYFKKFPNNKEKDFKRDLDKYSKIPNFKACENIHQIMTNYSERNDLPDVEENYVIADQVLTTESHWIMRMVTQYYFTEAFKAMKIDLEDDNVREQSLGKGTPGRIAKLYLGEDPEDTTELLSGRWNKEPYIACFPNTDKNHSVITKEVDVVACCSHHFLPFSTFNGGRAIIEYIPGEYVLGISKISRFINWCARRGWLQEDLTNYIGNTIKRIAATEDVHVKLEGLVHGCETFRGANSKAGNLTTEFKSGVFAKD